MKKVLIPICFSQERDRLVKGALEFLVASGGLYHCILLNTYMVPSSPAGEIIRVNDELRKKSIEGLQQTLQAAKTLLGSKYIGQVTFDIISHIGALANVIPRVVEEQGIDWVIVDKNGDPRQEKVVALLNRLQCPLVIIPF